MSTKPNFPSLSDKDDYVSRKLSDIIKYIDLNIKETETSLTNSNDHIPTSAAVYSALNTKFDEVRVKTVLTSNSDLYVPTVKAVNTALGDKLNSSALKTTITSSDSEVPSCKAVSTALSNKVTAESGKGLSTNDFTAEYNSKLGLLNGVYGPLLVTDNVHTFVEGLSNGVHYGYSNQAITNSPTTGVCHYFIDKVDNNDCYVIAIPRDSGTNEMYLKKKYDGTWGSWTKIGMGVDSALSSTSENPLQNKAIYTALGNKADTTRLDIPILSKNVTTYADSFSGTRGIYFAQHASTVAYDQPVTTESFYYIINVRDSWNVTIMAISHSGPTSIYLKSKNTSSWGSWVKCGTDIDNLNRLNSVLLSKNVTTYVDGDNNNEALTAGIYFARHPTDTAYDKPVSDERCFYIINVYATTTASIMAIQGQQRASSKIYVKTKTENTWGDWIQIAGNVTTSITNSDEYIPTSKAVYTALGNKINTSSLKTTITSSDDEVPSCKAVSTALSNKVTAVDGKGLSTNDFTTTYMNKVDRFDSPLLTKNVTTYVDGITTAGVYFARHATSPAYDKPVSDERCFYIINVYATTTASVMAIQGQQRASSKIYIKTKTENTWGDWIQITGNVTTSILDSDEYIPTSKAVNTALSNKVTTVSGKGLSTNDFTTTYKDKVDRLDAPLISKNVKAYADDISTAGVYFARHATTPAYDQPVASTRYYYIINVYSEYTAAIIAIPGQSTTDCDMYITVKTYSTWGSWTKINATIDSSLSSTSENPLQNKAIYTALGNKLNTSVLKTSITTSDSDIPSCKAVNTALGNKLNSSALKTSITTSDSEVPSCKAVSTALGNKMNTSALKTSITTSDDEVPSCKAVNTALSNKVTTVSGKGLSTNDFTTTYMNKVDRLDSPLLTKNVKTYVDGLSTAGVYFARHATTPAYDQPVSSTRYYYIINVYSSAIASIMAIPGQPRAATEFYIITKNESQWNAKWCKYTGTLV